MTEPYNVRKHAGKFLKNVTTNCDLTATDLSMILIYEEEPE
jgi:hypothetical protein